MKMFKEWVFVLCSCIASISAMAQNREISGKVVGNDNAPVPGATITVVETSQSVAASADGNFSISAPARAVTLSISSINFKTQEVKVAASQNTVTVTLSESGAQLGEVVVTALGIQRQAKTLVYATQTVKPAELTEARR